MRKFKLESGEDIDVIEHTKTILAQYEMVNIYVGCDSQNKKKGCVYATVIAYRFNYGNERWGARFIYAADWIPKTKDKFTRLWGEVERSVNLALWLEEQGFKVYKIDLDFNRKSNTGSNDMVAAGSGFVIGHGFDCSIKPDIDQCASRAADHIVKKRNSRLKKNKDRNILKWKSVNGPVAH